MEKDACSSGNCKTWTDCQIQNHNIYKRKPRMYSGCQMIQTSRFCHCDHSQYGKTYCADRKSQKRRPGMCPCLGSQKWRKDQISCPKNMENRVTPISILFFKLNFSISSPLFAGPHLRPADSCIILYRILCFLKPFLGFSCDTLKFFCNNLFIPASRSKIPIFLQGSHGYCNKAEL